MISGITFHRTRKLVPHHCTKSVDDAGREKIIGGIQYRVERRFAQRGASLGIVSEFHELRLHCLLEIRIPISKKIILQTIDAAMKYYDKTQFGRDRTAGDPQRFYNVNSLVWRCGAAGVRALPVLTAHDIPLPEQ